MGRGPLSSVLRTRGVKGRLSKMTKPQLKKMVDRTAPPSMMESAPATADRPKGDLELEPDDQSGGHYFRTTGKTVSDGEHEHTRDPWPADKPPPTLQRRRVAPHNNAVATRQ